MVSGKIEALADNIVNSLPGIFQDKKRMTSIELYPKLIESFKDKYDTNEILDAIKYLGECGIISVDEMIVSYEG